MAKNLAFHRLLLDFDLAGHPVGVSVESWDGDKRLSLTVLPIPGPFDNANDALAQALAFVQTRYGVHVTLY